MLPPRRCENLPTALEGRPGIGFVVCILITGPFMFDGGGGGVWD